MGVLTFDPFRTLAVSGARYLKAERWLEHRDLIAAADRVLFPPYWLVDALVHGFGARVFPSPATYHLGHDKIAMTRVLSTHWLEAIPETLIEANDAHGRAAVRDALPLPFVAKTPRASEGRGVFLIDTEAAWNRYLVTHDVLYAQRRLSLDRDLRLVVIGSDVVASYWRLAAPGAFHTNVAAGGRLDFAPPPAAAVALVQDVARRLGIDHAGFDVAFEDGRPMILEFNRLFGNVGLREQGIRADVLVAAHLQYLDAADAPRAA